jgi:pimeloyl-ACP methyl ester carboxylesterase
VLSIDPGNEAALVGLESLSHYGRNNSTVKPFSEPADASLEAFLSEQEAVHSINSLRPAKPAPCRAEPPAPDPEAAFSLPEPDSKFQSVTAPGMGTSGIDLAMISPEIIHTSALRGLLDDDAASDTGKATLHRAPLIPWRELPFTREQALLFGLGLVIAFMSLIGFSILKTVLHGPRVLAAPAPLATSTPLPTPVPQPTALVFQPTLVSSDCRFSLPPNAQVECYTMILPESRDGSTARSLRLPLAIYRSLNPFPPPDPIIYLHGGPGASALEWVGANFEGFMGPLLYERDVIVFDGRGFGQATPALDCPELLNQVYLELRQESNLEYRAADYGPAVKLCRDRLASQGIQLEQFSTAAMAADVLDIIKLLGYEQVNLYGVSFGASVAQVVAREHPEILRSLVLDSAFPLHGKYYNEIAGGAGRALQALFESCQMDSACRSQYPNLEAVYKELVAKLERNPLGMDATGSASSSGTRLVVDAIRFQEALRLALLTPGLTSGIPQGIQALRYGDTAFVEAAFSAPRMYFADSTMGTIVSILCTEQAYATTPVDLEASLEANPTTAALTRYSFYGSGKDLFEICDLWQAAPFDSQIKALPTGATPTLLLSGALDPLGSPDLLEGLALGLQNLAWVHFSTFGHGLSLGPQSACPLSIALAFLHDPTSDLSLGCGGELKSQD